MVIISFFVIYKKKEAQPIYNQVNQTIQENAVKSKKFSVDETANWNTYSSSIYKITFKYPPSWGRVINDIGIVGDKKGERVSISPFLGDEMTIDDIVDSEVNQRMQPYGENPTIEKLKIEDQEGRLIISEAALESNSSFYPTAALIIKYPKPIKISRTNKNYIDTNYNYLVINFSGIKSDLVKKIIETIKFYNIF